MSHVVLFPCFLRADLLVILKKHGREFALTEVSKTQSWHRAHQATLHRPLLDQFGTVFNQKLFERIIKMIYVVGLSYAWAFGSVFIPISYPLYSSRTIIMWNLIIFHLLIEGINNIQMESLTLIRRRIEYKSNCYKRYTYMWYLQCTFYTFGAFTYIISCTYNIISQWKRIEWNSSRNPPCFHMF